MLSANGEKLAQAVKSVRHAAEDLESSPSDKGARAAYLHAVASSEDILSAPLDQPSSDADVWRRRLLDEAAILRHVVTVEEDPSARMRTLSWQARLVHDLSNLLLRTLRKA
ncbi:MAG: hypothetical protein KIT25_02920 [Enhydrobacter sp.]|nr:MAG: hypothetical protein KIT25_02920 [Enhydrobacter sp.]